MATDSYLRDGAFMPETTAAMGEAFEAACDGLQVANQSNGLRALIATRIIAAARRGETDPVRLRMEAVAGISIAKIPPLEIPKVPQQPDNNRYANLR
ncbi:MAG: hypothetical protein J2P54_00830 [Bradyrhizobiaceae bacterium]|nr:hypothetical protein [Bradyrhizobiaceae bacterium]